MATGCTGFCITVSSCSVRTEILPGGAEGQVKHTTAIHRHCSLHQCRAKRTATGTNNRYFAAPGDDCQAVGLHHKQLLAVCHQPPQPQPGVCCWWGPDLSTTVNLAQCVAISCGQAVQLAITCRYCQARRTAAEAQPQVSTGRQHSAPELRTCTQRARGALGSTAQMSHFTSREEVALAQHQESKITGGMTTLLTLALAALQPSMPTQHLPDLSNGNTCCGPLRARCMWLTCVNLHALHHTTVAASKSQQPHNLPTSSLKQDTYACS